MKKYKAILPLMALSITTMAQQEKWSLGINFSPDYTFYTIYAANKKAEAAVQSAASGDRPSMGLTASLSVARRLGNRWQAGAGIQYMTLTWYSNPLHYYVEPAGLSIQPPTDLPEEKDRVSYIGVPIYLNYTFALRERWQLYATAGATARFYLNTGRLQRIGISDGNSTEKNIWLEHKDYYQTGLITQIGMGAAYHATKRLSFTAAPTFRFHLTPMNRTGNAGYYPYAAGLDLGARYTF